MPKVKYCVTEFTPTANGIPYKDIVERARIYIHNIGGFEKFAEWGLIRAKDL